MIVPARQKYRKIHVVESNRPRFGVKVAVSMDLAWQTRDVRRVASIIAIIIVIIIGRLHPIATAGALLSK